MTAKTPKPDQKDRFIETARKLGADEDETAFKAKLVVIARQKPAGHPVTASERQQIEAEMAATKPSAEAADPEADLAAARAALERHQTRFDNYNGNNPNKYRTDIKRAQSEVRTLEAVIARQKVKSESPKDDEK